MSPPRILPVLALLALPAAADEIYAKQGSKPLAANVMIVEESGGKIVYLDKTLKRRSWPASMVGRIVKSHSDVHTYHERLEAAMDADAVMAVAAWALEKNFKENVLKPLHLRALEMDPDHEGANLALGRVRYQGEWMTPEGRDLRMKEEQEAAQRAKGLVRW
ncbi:MAG: hypothetical protein ACYSX0_15210, partial [Planctomycetota bacterium]